MKILVIEPNRPLLDSLIRYLCSKGHDAIPVFDGVIGVNEFDNSFDLVIIDVSSPRISWQETVTLLKRKKPNLSVFVITDSILIPVDLLVENTIVDEFFTLPFNAYWLNFSLEKLINKRHGYDLFLTIKEEELLSLIEQKGHLPFSQIDSKLYRIDEISILISSINKKLKGKQIIIEEKGFKLVEQND